MNILMISADRSVAAGEKGPFHNMLQRFSTHFDRIDVIGLRPARVKERRVFGNVYLHPPEGGKVRQPGHILRTGRRLLAERPYAFAVSHDYNPFYNGLGAWLLHRKTGLPYISEIHHVPGYPRAATLRERIDRLCTRLYVRWVQHRALAIRVVNGKEMPGLLRKWGVQPGKITVLHSLYIDFETFRPPGPGEAEEKRYDLLFCGRLAPNKGIFIVLEALDRLRRLRPEVRLLLIGRGPLEARIEHGLRRLGLEANVERIPWVAEPAKLAALYRAARLVVCASFSEGGPRFTVEAMACGTPVVSTPVGIMSELVEDGENGLLFSWDPAELADKVDRLLRDEERYRVMRARLPGTVAPFERDRVITALADGFKGLVGKGGGRGGKGG